MGKKSKILIVANFTGAETDKNRFGNIASLLSLNGYDVELITTTYDHSKKKYKEFQSPVTNYKITRLPEPGYPSNISPKRLYSHKIWGKNVYKYVKKLSSAPDLIYCAIPSLTAAKKLGLYCHKNNISFVVDIQDLWPEAFQILLKYKALGNFLFKPFHLYADKAYKWADLVAGVSDTYTSRGVKALHPSKTKNALTVYLGNNINIFDNANRNSSVETPYFKIGYIGTLGYSYDIKCVIDAVKILKEQKGIDNIKFIIMGDGPLRKDFENYSKEKGIDTLFTGALPYPQMVTELCGCDIVVNPIVKGGAQSITNKVGDYAFSGKPVVNTQPNPEYRNLIMEYECGINCEVGDSKEMADAIFSLYKDESLRKRMGGNSRKLGEERFDRNKTYPLLVAAIENLLKTKN